MFKMRTIHNYLISFVVIFILLVIIAIIKLVRQRRGEKRKYQKQHCASVRQLEEGLPGTNSGESDATKATGEGEARGTPDLGARAFHELTWPAGRQIDTNHGAEADFNAEEDAVRPKGLIPLKLGQPGQEGQ